MRRWDWRCRAREGLNIVVAGGGVLLSIVLETGGAAGDPDWDVCGFAGEGWLIMAYYFNLFLFFMCSFVVLVR